MVDDLAIDGRKLARLTSSRVVFSLRTRVPLRHVSITTISPEPIANGIHPPSTILSKLAIKKIESTARNGMITTTAVSGGQCQHFHITKNAMILVMIIVPVSYTHLRAHETGRNLVCRLLLEKKKQ